MLNRHSWLTVRPFAFVQSRSRIPRRMRRKPSTVAPKYNFGKNSDILHEIENILVGGGGRVADPSIRNEGQVQDSSLNVSFFTKFCSIKQRNELSGYQAKRGAL